MKQRIKHFSKSTMSVILAVCMLVSCLTVGLIATDAAQVTSENRVGASVGVDESVGWTAADCYMHYSADGGTNWVNAAMDSEEKITLTLYSETTIRYFLVAESTWYRYNGYYTDKPSGTSTSSDSFYARISGKWNDYTKDSAGKMTDNGNGTYSITFSEKEMGWYRFKINGYDGAASLGTWGGANVTYASDEGTAACITDKSTENSGNAKFYLTKTSDVTVTINTSTHEITVSAAATPGTVGRMKTPICLHGREKK